MCRAPRQFGQLTSGTIGLEARLVSNASSDGTVSNDSEISEADARIRRQLARGGHMSGAGYSTHHIQRGDVTAVVWGAPGAAPAADGSGDACPESSSSKTRAAATTTATAVVDAESLTRGRRSENPFVQQCDLVFPLPGRESFDGGAGVLEEQEVGMTCTADSSSMYLDHCAFFVGCLFEPVHSLLHAHGRS